MLAEMTINGVDIKTYNARLQNYSVGGTTVTNNISNASTLLRVPSLFSTVLSTRQLTITITFKPSRIGDNSKRTSVKEKLKTAADNIARFEAEIIGKVVEITLPDDFTYTALAASPPAATFDSSGEHDVIYTFSAIRHKAEETIEVKPGGQIFCSSTTKTPCKIILGITTSGSITINEVTVKNVIANSEIIIDGLNGLITMNGNNKIIDTDLIDFPYLYPGYNTISCSDRKATIKVVYTPVFV